MREGDEWRERERERDREDCCAVQIRDSLPLLLIISINQDDDDDDDAFQISCPKYTVLYLKWKWSFLLDQSGQLKERFDECADVELALPRHWAMTINFVVDRRTLEQPFEASTLWLCKMRVGNKSSIGKSYNLGYGSGQCIARCAEHTNEVISHPSSLI